MKHEFLPSSLVPDSLIVLGIGPDFVPSETEQVELLLQPAYRDATSEKRKLDFYRGRKLAREGLARISGRDPGWLARGADGIPVWPLRATGSISHAMDGAAAWVALGPGLPAMGIDLQDWVADERAEGMRSRVLTETEARVVQGGEKFTMAWTMKECVFKCLGNSGHKPVDFRAVTIENVSGSRWSAAATLPDGSRRAYQGEWRKLDGHCLAWGVQAQGLS